MRARKGRKRPRKRKSRPAKRRMNDSDMRDAIHLLALDQGTTSSRASSSTADGGIVAVAQREFAQIYPAARLGRARPEAIWRTPARSAREAIAKAGVAAPRHRRDRHHQPARDHAAVGPRDRRAGRTTRSSGRTAAPADLRRACAPRARRPDPRAHRPRARPLFLRHQAALDARKRRRGARGRGARRARLRHGRQLAALAADRWRL